MSAPTAFAYLVLMKAIFDQDFASTSDHPRSRTVAAAPARSLRPAGMGSRLPHLEFASPAAPDGRESKPSTGTGGDRELLEALAQSKLYQEYERAFTDTTGLPVILRPVESWQIPLHGQRNESPYCALMAGTSRACAGCLQMQEVLAQKATADAHTLECTAGLCETAVPVRLGDRLIGFLQTGQVFSRKPSARQFERTAEAMAGRGLDRNEMKEAYFATRVMAPRQQESATKLLSIFAQHLSMLSNQVMVQRANAEPPFVTKAKAFIQEHLAEELALGQVAKVAGMSSYYFCKMFRKATGVNFTDYLSRVRIERARDLLLNPNLRISEIAFDVGFQSLTHFNRVFRRVLGQSPTEYRGKLMGVGV